MVTSAVIFDGDDTLWWAERLYDDAIARSMAVLAADGFPADEWKRLQRRRDLENVRTMGMSRQRFPLSSKQALHELSASTGQPVSTSTESKLINYAEAVFSTKAPVAPGARDTLLSLRTSGYRIALLTKGDPSVQQQRISDSGLGDLFDEISIVQEKTEASFKDLLTSLEADPAHGWSVGNSLPSDINPALRIGMHAIWIDAHVWEHERREADPHGELVLCRSLRDVPGIIMSSGVHADG
jgi:putative hydrolase of the HAD superfamily